MNDRYLVGDRVICATTGSTWDPIDARAGVIVDNGPRGGAEPWYHVELHGLTVNGFIAEELLLVARKQARRQ